jgi:hypothetical protein
VLTSDLLHYTADPGYMYIARGTSSRQQPDTASFVVAQPHGNISLHSTGPASKVVKGKRIAPVPSATAQIGSTETEACSFSQRTNSAVKAQLPASNLGPANE